MAIELQVPAVGESITEVLIAAWLKAPGERVARDEPLVELETDKATVELPAPADGTVLEVLKPAGTTAQVGEVIGMFAESAADDDGGEEAPAQRPVAAKPDARGVAAQGAAAGSTAGAPARVMPAARRELAARGLDASQVAATGPGGRLLKEDVQRHAAAGAEGAAPAAAPPPVPAQRRERAAPVSPIRRRIAERLVEAQQTAALLTTFNEIDMSAVIALRREHQEAFQQRHGVKLGFMSFFVRAVIEALREVPQLNAELRGQEIIYRDYYDIGIAIGGGKGLAVPIIRNAETMSLAALELAVADFAARAAANKLDLSELQGGTFTISNGGVYGSLLSTPIVNPPQSGILGLHAIQERPVARDGQVVIRPMMYVALTYDHRLVDGREAVTCLRAVKERIEAPARLFLEI